MNETRLPSGDPLSTRTRPEEAPWEMPDDEGIEIRLFPDEEPGAPVILLQDSDLRR